MTDFARIAPLSMSSTSLRRPPVCSRLGLAESESGSQGQCHCQGHFSHARRIKRTKKKFASHLLVNRLLSEINDVIFTSSRQIGK